MGLLVNFSIKLIFQSTLPRGERLTAGAGYVIDKKISIHAPARGATVLACLQRSGSTYFNPRSREGSDQAYSQERGRVKISIHAPARGATLLCGGELFVAVFQSTLPRGERLCFSMASSGLTDFNPRSREGSDE